ncbi:DUF2511 domain-containing protein [Mycolicibacterium peregrinum]|uniref:DUF2511 domain-containing protein n=1 Tax=Mycolicibacterium peregrinum TaxID=43304 RepID=UPI003AAA2691
MRLLVGAVGCVLAMVTVGCSTGGDSQTASETTTPATSQAVVSETASSPPGTPPPAGYVSRATWTDGPWPLTVDEAVLECQGDSLVTIAAGEAKYSLNAAAHTQTGLPDYADAIGLPDPAKPGMHLDASPLIERGLALCATATSPTTSTGGSNRPAGLVERQTWNDGPWPFTVDTATLFCTKAANGERVTVVADGEMYALNGTAKSTNLWPPFDPIWIDNPNIAGLKVDIGPMINRGIALCAG